MSLEEVERCLGELSEKGVSVCVSFVSLSSGASWGALELFSGLGVRPYLLEFPCSGAKSKRCGRYALSLSQSSLWFQPKTGSAL